MRSALLISYENAAASVNPLNLGCCEPEAVQFNFSLVGFISLSFPLSLSLSLKRGNFINSSLLCLPSVVSSLVFGTVTLLFPLNASPVWYRRLSRSVRHAGFEANLGSRVKGEP